MYFCISKFYHKTKRQKEGYKETEIHINILHINEGKKIYKMSCCVVINCINRLEKGIRLFKFPANNIRQLAVK